MTPDLNDLDTRVLLAVTRLQRPTFANLMADAGVTNHTLGVSLRRLRDLGFITFVDHKHGTIRSLVRAVAVRTP